MIRVIFLFLILAAICYIGIKATETMTGKQLVMMTKIAGYVLVSAALAIVLMFGVYIFF